jgi:hypothetical protein
MDCLRVVLSLILPPIGVFLKVGFGLHFWLNIFGLHPGTGSRYLDHRNALRATHP